MNEDVTINRYRNPVFIVGMPRSGTTLLQGILCNSGLFSPIPETHYFSRASYKMPEILSRKNKNKIFKSLKKKSRIDVKKESIYQFNTRKEIFEYVINQYNDDNDTFLEKTPRHVFFYTTLCNYYPFAKFVCMIREPKNVISSQISSTRIQNKSIIRIAALYNKIADAIISIRENDRVIVIRYEELTTDPENVIHNIFDFLNIHFRQEYIQNVTAPPKIISTNEFWKTKNMEYDSIRPNDENKWKKNLNESTANLINYLTKTKAEKFGYKIECDVISAYYEALKDVKHLCSWRELKRYLSKVQG
jgi:hypothetical protein